MNNHKPFPVFSHWKHIVVARSNREHFGARIVFLLHEMKHCEEQVAK
jgi:hypothetical protein